jgi:photosystem II stability/assembly factor-like uncharacterized protein
MKTFYLLIVYLSVSSFNAQPFYEISRLPVNEQNGIQFTDADHGFWWGSKTRGLLLRTSNKGLSWDSLIIPGFTQSGNSRILSAHFFNNDTGLVAVVNYNNNTNGIYKTYDNGTSWIYKSSYNWPLGKIVFRNNLGYAFTGLSNNIEVLKSTDFGETWTSIQYSLQMPDNGAIQITDAFITPAGDFIGVTDGGKIFKYTSASNTWQIQYNNANLEFNKIFFPTPQTGYALGNTINCLIFPNQPLPLCGYILKTTDFGSTWDTLPRLNDGAGCINAVSADTIYLGYFSKILYSTDGGVTRQLLPNTNFPAFEVQDIVIKNKKVEYVFATATKTSKLFYKYPLDSLTIGLTPVKTSDLELTIFPNPSPGDFQLKIKHCNNCLFSAAMYDLRSGLLEMRLQRQKINAEDSGFLINTNYLVPGIYVLRVMLNDQHFSYKVIKSPY